MTDSVPDTPRTQYAGYQSSSITRARVIGGLVLIAAFAAGVLVGRYLPPTEVNGVTIKVIGTDKIPAELDGLGLSDSQQVQIRGFLRAGTRRVDRVVQGFLIPMDAAVDSTDREIRSILSEAQNRTLDAWRVEHPMRRVKKERIVKDSGR